MLNIIGNDILYDYEVVARITVPESTLRERFTSIGLLNIDFDETIDNVFTKVENAMKEMIETLVGSLEEYVDADKAEELSIVIKNVIDPGIVLTIVEDLLSNIPRP